MFDDCFSGSSDCGSTSLFDDPFSTHTTDINPANGLPMVGCVDVMGNPRDVDHSSIGSPIGGSLFDSW